MLVITTRNEKHFLNYLDTANGRFTFDKTIKVKGHVGYTLTTDNGILYATAEEMNKIFFEVSINLSNCSSEISQ